MSGLVAHIPRIMILSDLLTRLRSAVPLDQSTARLRSRPTKTQRAMLWEADVGTDITASACLNERSYRLEPSRAWSRRSASRGTVIDVPQVTHKQMMMSWRSAALWSCPIPQIGHPGRISHGVLVSVESPDKRWTPGWV